MIDIGKAQQEVLEEIPIMGMERIHIQDGLGRVLAHDIHARRDVPYTNNSAMDGYACLHDDIAGATSDNPARVKLIGEAPAGRIFEGTVRPGEAVRILTGGVTPDGADTVVMVEDTSLENDVVSIFKDPGKGSHIRPKGEDVLEGDTVLHQGDIIRPPEIGMLATLGHAYVHVYQRPLVAILSTGDELVDLDEPFTIGKVVCSNSYSLGAQVAECGAMPLSLGIAGDDESDQRAKISDGLRADVILTSGGVSVGKYDLVKDTLSQLGMKVKFWKVAMKPGKPLVFGTIGNKPVFGLPGNPTSAMISFEQFVRPAILKMMGHTNLYRPLIEAVLGQDAPKEPTRPHLVRCRLVDRDGQLTAVVAGAQSSGALRSMVLADGLMILTPEDAPFTAGKKVPVQMLHTNSPLSPYSPFSSGKGTTGIHLVVQGVSG